MQLLEVDPATGATVLVREDSDGDWLDIVPGVPVRLSDGTLVWTADAAGVKRLIVGDEDVSGDLLQVRRGPRRRRRHGRVRSLGRPD